MKSTINEHKKNNFKIVSKTLKFYSLFFIITLLGCTEENNYYTTADGLGKTNVYIEGDLTDAEVAEKLANEVGSITENIYIGSLENYTTSPNITTIELDLPTNVRLVQFQGNYDNLRTIKIKGHGRMPFCKIYVYGGKNTESVLVEGITELNLITAGFDRVEKINSTIEIKDLEEVRLGFDFGGRIDNLVPNSNHVLICNDLKYVNKELYYNLGGGSANGYIDSFSMNALEDMSNASLFITSYGQVTFPALKHVKDVNCSPIHSYPIINPIIYNLPELLTANRIYCSGALLYTLNLNKLTSCQEIQILKYDLPSINFNAPVLNYCLNYQSRNLLTTSGVNAVLNKFLTIQPSSGKYIDLTQEVAPTGQGIIDKQTLITQGNQVYTN